MVHYAPTAQSRDYALTNASISGQLQPGLPWAGLWPKQQTKLAVRPYHTKPQGHTVCCSLHLPKRRHLPRGALAVERAEAQRDDGRLTDQFATTRNYYVENRRASLTKIIRHSIFSLPQKETKLTGQWERRRTVRPADPESGAASQINRTELISDLGLSYELAPGWDLLVGGKRQIWQEDLAEKSQDSIGAGLRIRVNPTAIFQLSWDKYLSEDADGTIYGLHVKAEF